MAKVVPGEATRTFALALSAAAMVLLGAVGTAHANPDKVAYELSKECGQSAGKLFDRHKAEEPKPFAGQSWTNSFESHYNPTLNACYMLEENILSADYDRLITWELWDVNDNHEIAEVFCSRDVRKTEATSCDDNPGAIRPDFGAKILRYLERDGAAPQ